MELNKFRIEGIPAILWGEPGEKIIIAAHGSHSSKIDDCIWLLAEEATAKGYQVLSFDLPQHGERVYETDFIMPNECIRELKEMYSYATKQNKTVSLFGCSMGAYFELLTFSDMEIENVWFLSPVTDMERIIHNLMNYCQITEEEFKEKVKVDNDIEPLFFPYYEYVKSHPIKEWNHHTYILRGENDTMCEYDYEKPLQTDLAVNLQCKKAENIGFIQNPNLNFSETGSGIDYDKSAFNGGNCGMRMGNKGRRNAFMIGDIVKVTVDRPLGCYHPIHEDIYYPILSCLVTALVLSYATGFMLKLRKKEFGMYITLGMTRRNIQRIFAGETGILSLAALLIGMGAGLVMFQLLIALFASIMDKPFDVSSYSLQGILLTVTVSVGLFFLSTLASMRYLKKVTVAELLKEDAAEKSEKHPVLWGIVSIMVSSGLIYGLVKTYQTLMAAFKGQEGLQIFIWLVLDLAMVFLFHVALSRSITGVLLRNRKLKNNGTNTVVLRSLSRKMTMNSILIGALATFLPLSQFNAMLEDCGYEPVSLQQEYLLVTFVPEIAEIDFSGSPITFNDTVYSWVGSETFYPEFTREWFYFVVPDAAVKDMEVSVECIAYTLENSRIDGQALVEEIICAGMQ